MSWIVQLYKAAEAALTRDDPYSFLRELHSGCEAAAIYKEEMEDRSQNRKETHTLDQLKITPALIENLKELMILYCTHYPSLAKLLNSASDISAVLNHSVFDAVQRAEMSAVIEKRIAALFATDLREAYKTFFDGTLRSYNWGLNTQLLLDLTAKNISGFAKIDPAFALRICLSCSYIEKQDPKIREFFLAEIPKHLPDSGAPLDHDTKSLSLYLRNYINCGEKFNISEDVVRAAYSNHVQRLIQFDAGHERKNTLSENFTSNTRPERDLISSPHNAIMELVRDVRSGGYSDAYVLHIAHCCFFDNFDRLLALDPIETIKLGVKITYVISKDSIGWSSDEKRHACQREAQAFINDIALKFTSSTLAENGNLILGFNPFLEVGQFTDNAKRRVAIFEAAIQRAETDAPHAQMIYLVKALKEVAAIIELDQTVPENRMGFELREKAAITKQKAVAKAFHYIQMYPKDHRKVGYNQCLALIPLADKNLQSDLLRYALKFIQSETRGKPSAVISELNDLMKLSIDCNNTTIMTEAKTLLDHIKTPQPFTPEEIEARDHFRSVLSRS